MTAIPMLWHPDRFDRQVRLDQLDPFVCAAQDERAQPLNLADHWLRFIAQAPLIVATTSAHDGELLETDIDASVPSTRVRLRTPIYIAFARFRHDPSLNGFEGAYIVPLAHRGVVDRLSVAYIRRGGHSSGMFRRETDLESVRIELLHLASARSLLRACEQVDYLAGDSKAQKYRQARLHLVKILCSMRLQHGATIQKRRNPPAYTPRYSRFTPRFPVLGLGPDDAEYAIRQTGSAGGGAGVLHHFQRGALRVVDTILRWEKPSLMAEPRDLADPIL